MKKVLLTFVLALAIPATMAWTGFKILTITIDEPFSGWYPYNVTNTSDKPVCFSYSACDDQGKPDANGRIGDDHKRVCVTKKTRLTPGKSLSPDQNYGEPSITNVRTCD